MEMSSFAVCCIIHNDNNRVVPQFSRAKKCAHKSFVGNISVVELLLK
jgi:hypothetical protein